MARVSPHTPTPTHRPIQRYCDTPTVIPIGQRQIDTYLTFEQNVADDRLFSLVLFIGFVILFVFSLSLSLFLLSAL